MNYKINLYTTEGCFACSIMNDNIQQAINSIEDFNPEYNSFDKNYCWKEILKAEGVTDFPTMVFYINDKISFKLIGIYSTKDIEKHIRDVINK